MYTAIGIRSKANPDNIVSSSYHIRQLSAKDIRNEIKTLMTNLDPDKHVVDGPHYANTFEEAYMALRKSKKTSLRKETRGAIWGQKFDGEATLAHHLR